MSNISENNFCTCHITKCARHPMNHNEGCTPCMKHNLEQGKVPNCLFKKVSGDTSQVHDLTIKGFVEFYHAVNGKH